MNLSGRERNLLIALGGVVLVMAVWFLFLKPSNDPIVLPDELFPTISPSVVVPSGEGSGGSGSGSASPTFVVPVGARDPFKA